MFTSHLSRSQHSQTTQLLRFDHFSFFNCTFKFHGYVFPHCLRQLSLQASMGKTSAKGKALVLLNTSVKWRLDQWEKWRLDVLTISGRTLLGVVQHRTRKSAEGEDGLSLEESFFENHCPGIAGRILHRWWWPILSFESRSNGWWTILAFAAISKMSRIRFGSGTVKWTPVHLS